MAADEQAICVARKLAGMESFREVWLVNRDGDVRQVVVYPQKAPRREQLEAGWDTALTVRAERWYEALSQDRKGYYSGILDALNEAARLDLGLDAMISDGLRAIQTDRIAAGEWKRWRAALRLGGGDLTTDEQKRDAVYAILTWAAAGLARGAQE
jgi:hypothetical protein